MRIEDKRNLLPKLSQLKRVVLELGCGNRKRREDSIGIDIIDYDCVDIVGDVYEVLREIPTNSIDEVYSHHFFEHVRDVTELLDELARVLRRGGILEIVAPHFSNPYFYSDYTHRNFFGLYSFAYLADSSLFARRVPTYNKRLQFKLCSVDLVFKSARPFYLRYVLKRILGVMINLHRYVKEFYEENLCYVLPCYEIRYVLIRK